MTIRDELEPNEKSSFKIYEHAGETEEFPKTDFIVKAEGIDYTRMEEVSFDELIGDINNLSAALKAIPEEVTTTVTTVYENDSRVLNNVTEIPENGSSKSK